MNDIIEVSIIYVYVWTLFLKMKIRQNYDYQVDCEENYDADIAHEMHDDIDSNGVESDVAPAKRRRQAVSKVDPKSSKRSNTSQSSSQRSGRSLPGFMGGSKKTRKKSSHASDDWA